jgi:MerR family transcriptional regulator, light-induced transcriptional regulator
MKSKDNSLLDAGVFARAKGIFATSSSRLPADAVQALASEVIARLSSRGPVVTPSEGDTAEVVIDHRMDQRIDLLCHALLAIDDREATDLVMQAHAEGASVETLYLGYLAEAARRLGRWWQDDRVGSVEVVIGAGRIYAIMRGLRRLFAPGQMRDSRFRAVFASVPGETHMLGVAMAADLLTMHGWEIDLRAGLDHDSLVAEVGSVAYPIIGLSASSTRMLFPLARLIVALRVSNPGAWIIVSGPIVAMEPEVAHLVDADAAATDFTEAEAMMESYLTAYKEKIGG